METREICEVIKGYKTPLYLFNMDELKNRVKDIKEILGGDVKVCYAMKANPFFLNELRDIADAFEVCSFGEFAICEREEIPMEKIILSGVNKGREDVEGVLDRHNGRGVYTVESMQHLKILNECALAKNLTIELLLRLTSGNQFGMDEEQIREIVKMRHEYPGVLIKGLQLYSGTQKKTTDINREELERMVALSKDLEKEYGLKLERIEYGPGLSVDYFGTAAYNNTYDAVKELATIIKDTCEGFEVTLEMGRFIAASCGYFVSEIADIKNNQGQNYVIIDGGINHINYYGQVMAMKVPAYSNVNVNGEILEGIEVVEKMEEFKKSKNGEFEDYLVSNCLEACTVCGSLCTVADLVVKNLPLIEPQIGDKIIFRNIGSYSITEGIYLFLSRKMPLVLAYSKDKGIEVYRDVYASDRINSRDVTL